MHVSYGMDVVQRMKISWNSFNWKPLGLLLGCQNSQARNPYTLKPVGRLLSCGRRRRKLTLFHKIHSNIAPEYLNDCLNEYYYNLRNSLQYRVPRCRLETFSKSFFPSTIRLWNSWGPTYNPTVR